MAGWSQTRVGLEHHMNDFSEFNRVTGGKRRIVAGDDLLVEPVHVVSLEGWSESGHLVQDAAEGPYVTLEVIWSVLPHLRTGIVWCTSLSLEETIFGINDFRDVKISQFAGPV